MDCWSPLAHLWTGTGVLSGLLTSMNRFMLFLVSLTLTFVTVSFFSLFEGKPQFAVEAQTFSEGIPSLLPSSLPVLNSRRQPVLDTLLDRYSMFIDESFAYTANISSFSFLTSVSLLKKLELQRLKVACDHRYIQVSFLLLWFSFLGCAAWCSMPAS